MPVRSAAATCSSGCSPQRATASRTTSELGEAREPASRRLGFRELGLAIGLASARRSPRLAVFEAYAALRAELESFWLDPAHRRAETWSEHRDINEVMLATSLVPDGFLEL